MFFQLKNPLAFHDTLLAMRDGRWSDAKAGMLNSAWAHQTPGRVQRMAAQIETGQWQARAGGHLEAALKEE
jgi:lysozyme